LFSCLFQSHSDSPCAMSPRYHIGQLVVVRVCVEENWHCARVYQVTPQVLVKRRPRSTPSKFNFVKPLEAMDDNERQKVLALEQQLRNREDIGPDPPPMGLSAER